MIEETIMTIIEEMLNLEQEEIYLSANLKDDLGMDSLDIIELMMTLEEECLVSFLDKETANFKTVSDIISHVKKEQRKK